MQRNRIVPGDVSLDVLVGAGLPSITHEQTFAFGESREVVIPLGN